MLGGPAAAPGQVSGLSAALREDLADSPIVGAVIGLTAGPPEAGVGAMDSGVADRLGVDRLTVLAVRPDRFLGLRDDGGDAATVHEYLRLLTG